MHLSHLKPREWTVTNRVPPKSGPDYEFGTWFSFESHGRQVDQKRDFSCEGYGLHLNTQCLDVSLPNSMPLMTRDLVMHPFQSLIIKYNNKYNV